MQEYGAENPAGQRTCDEELYGQRHDEVAAVGRQIVRNELCGESVTVPNAQNARQCHLANHREYLNREYNGDRAIARLDHAEREKLRDGARNKESAQENQDELNPHALQGDPEGYVGEAVRGKHGVVQRHDVHHDPSGDRSKYDRLKFCLRHFSFLRFVVPAI